MKPLQIKDVSSYIEENIELFHQKRLQRLNNLNLEKIVRRKNPYLFRAKNMLTAEQIVKGWLDAHLSSNEETMFGDWLENLAIFINGNVYGGWKSGIPCVDLEFEADNKRYIVTIKSGPNWGNNSQIEKMKADFTSAKKTLRTSGSNLHVVAVIGCCYGKEKKLDKGDYFKYCGENFWKFISADDELFTKIIEPLGHAAGERNDDFSASYAQIVNMFTIEFTEKFCTPSGEIDWERLVRFNSAAI